MSDYYNKSSYATVYYRFAPYTRVNVTLSFHLLLYFLLFSVFSFLSFSITYLVIPYGRTDGRRGLSKLLLHGTRENRNTPENSPPPLFFYVLRASREFAREEPALPNFAPSTRSVNFFLLGSTSLNTSEKSDFLKCLDKVSNNPIYKTFCLSKVQLELTEK